MDGNTISVYPKVIYGAVTLAHDLDKLEEAFQSVWHQLHPTLRLNQHITKEFCTPPFRFQGLALPNPNIDVLSLNINLMREHWEKKGSIVGKMLEVAYLVFKMEVGVRSNVLTRPYKTLGCLAMHSFFKNL